MKNQNPNHNPNKGTVPTLAYAVAGGGLVTSVAAGSIEVVGFDHLIKDVSACTTQVCEPQVLQASIDAAHKTLELGGNVAIAGLAATVLGAAAMLVRRRH